MSQTLLPPRCLLLVACFVPLLVSGFQAAVPHVTHLNTALLSSLTSAVTEPQSIAALSQDEERNQLPDSQSSSLKLTPMQIKTLRKEVIKRQARHDIAKVFLNELETMGPFSKETIESVVSLLRVHELVEVRGIARGDDTRHVHGISELLLMELNRNNLPATERVITKGHSTVFFSSSSSSSTSAALTSNDKNDGDDPTPASEKLIVRSSYRPNAWTKRVKAKRDHRGHIVKE